MMQPSLIASTHTFSAARLSVWSLFPCFHISTRMFQLTDTCDGDNVILSTSYTEGDKVIKNYAWVNCVSLRKGIKDKWENWTQHLCLSFKHNQMKLYINNSHNKTVVFHNIRLAVDKLDEDVWEKSNY